MKTKTTIILSIVVLFLVFMLGRCSNVNKNIAKTEETIKYVPSPYPVHDTIYQPKPYEVIRHKRDTMYLTQDVDTAKILEDYFLTRRYELDFSSDSVGVFKVNAEVSRNELTSAKSFIQPKYKTIVQENTIYKVPSLQFYAMVGSSLDFKTNKVSLGVDLKQKYLLGVSGVRFNENFSYTIDVGIKW